MQFNQQELSVLLALTKRVQITGEEAMTIVMLQQKIQSYLDQPVKSSVERQDAPGEEKTNETNNS